MEKKMSPIEEIVGGVVFFIIGIVIVVKNSSSGIYHSYSSFGSSFFQDDSMKFMGVVISLVGLAGMVTGVIRFRSELEDDDNDYKYRPVEDFTERLAEERKPAPAPAPVPEAVRAEIPVVKKIVYCPYCGTAQKEDYLSCDSCGAGRKK